MNNSLSRTNIYQLPKLDDRGLNQLKTRQSHILDKQAVKEKERTQQIDEFINSLRKQAEELKTTTTKTDKKFTNTNNSSLMMMADNRSNNFNNNNNMGTSGLNNAVNDPVKKMMAAWNENQKKTLIEILDSSDRLLEAKKRLVGFIKQDKAERQ